MDDDVELHRLRERVYGAAGADATPAMIRRLAELEERGRPVVGLVDEPASADASAPFGELASDESPDEVAVDEPETPAARPILRGLLTTMGALALVGLGVAIGATTTASMSAATADSAAVDPAAALYPELTFPQTIDDAISADILRDSAIDSGSTRYIATVRGFRIYFAQPDDGDGRCIVTFTASDNRPWSAGCVSGAQQGAAVFGIDDGLTVAIGDPEDSAIDGIPIRLSDSVTAYVAR